MYLGRFSWRIKKKALEKKLFSIRSEESKTLLFKFLLKIEENEGDKTTGILVTFSCLPKFYGGPQISVLRRFKLLLRFTVSILEGKVSVELLGVDPRLKR